MTMTADAQGGIDTRALEIAVKALEKIEGHQIYCERRDALASSERAELREMMSDTQEAVVAKVDSSSTMLHGRINRIWRYLLGLQATIIMGLFGLAIYLLQNGPPWHTVK